nr:MAG TPA: hypothetical protein [Caudoviricetes sp.]DAU61506.1 MAG TPA: hypothetical protein [Caudoviricetes sp.]DAX26802.1 MAG TPA: hypothetical protein [Caudoviricetes sp.]
MLPQGVFLYMCYAMPDSSKNDPEKRTSSNRVSVYID